MTMMKNDPSYIGWLLTCSDKRDLAVERAIVAIYNRQTEDEKHCEKTIHSNGIGFTGADDKMGSYLAKWILSGKHLTGRFLDKGRTIALKYRAQLADIATYNLDRKAIMSALNRAD